MAGITVQENYPDCQYENGILKGALIPRAEGYFRYGENLLESMKKNSHLIGQVNLITGNEDTFGSMAERSIRCALWLKKQGIQAGDVIGIITNPHINYIIPMISSLLVGSIFNYWQITVNKENIIHNLNLTKPKIVFADTIYAKFVQEVVNEMAINVKVIVFNKTNGLEDLESFEEILSAQDPKEIVAFECTKIDSPNHHAVIAYTSGSTGKPKGVLHSYGNLASTLVFPFEDTHESSTGLCLATIEWLAGVICLLRSICIGAKIIIYPGIINSDVIDSIDKYKIDWMYGGSRAYYLMLKDPIISTTDLSSVKFIHFGASNGQAALYESLHKYFPNARIHHSYACTEMGGRIAHAGDADTLETCGKILPNVELKAVDADMKSLLGPNEAGEFYIKSPHLMLGYYNNPAATAEVLDSDGWYYTGDEGYYNEKGYIYLTGRSKDVIRHKTMNISPQMIEDVLSQYPGVHEVAIVGKPCKENTEIPVAFIVKNSDADITEDKVIAYIKEKASLQVDLKDVKFIEELPRTSSGKISKGVLREMAK